MFNYDRFNNYGLKLPFDSEVEKTNGTRVENTSFSDIRAQALRLSPEEKIERLRRPFSPSFSAGVWYFGEHSSRFHSSYKNSMNLEEKADIACQMAQYGIKGIEAHYPWEISDQTLDIYRRMRSEAGIVVAMIGGIGGDFRARESRFGTVSSTIKEVRDKFTRGTVEQLLFARSLSEEQNYPVVAVCWPGIDGYTYPLGTDFYDMWDRFEASLAEAIDEVPGVRIAIEPKPYEPAINNIWRNTADGLTMARNVEARLKNPENIKLLQQGHALVGLNPEIGHVRMGFEETAYSYSSVMREARLDHTHWNSQPLGNFDQDLNPGVVAPECLEALIFACRMYGFNGFFGLDINPEKMPVQAALANSMNAITLANAVVDNLDAQKVLETYYQPLENCGIMEDLLIKARSKGVASSKLISSDVIAKLSAKY